MRAAGFVFEICAAEVDEARKGAKRRRITCADWLMRRRGLRAESCGGTGVRVRSGAQFLASAVVVRCRQGRRRYLRTLVIGADTVVVLEGEILGKPAGEAEARAMLKRLSGRSHEVHTGMALLRLPDGAMREFSRKSRSWNLLR